jgi:hypothetical protein
VEGEEAAQVIMCILLLGDLIGCWGEGLGKTGVVIIG